MLSYPAPNLRPIGSLVTALIVSLATTAGAAAAASVAVTLEPAHSQIAMIGACQSADQDARITHLALPSFPWDALSSTGTTVIEIQLSPNGNLAAKRVVSSSGDPMFDREALMSARRSTYAAEMRGCGRISGVYHLVVDFAK